MKAALWDSEGPMEFDRQWQAQVLPTMMISLGDDDGVVITNNDRTQSMVFVGPNSENNLRKWFQWQSDEDCDLIEENLTDLIRRFREDCA